MELEEAIEKTKELLNLNDLLFEETGTHLYLGNQEKELIQILLNHITKQEKMIELMALAISSYDGQLVINQYKDRNEVKEKFKEYVEDGTYEQYFEKKAEES